MTSPSKWKVIIMPDVKKRLAKLPRVDRKRILHALLNLQDDPFSQDVKPLKGRPEWRFRVGKWRVVLRMDKGNFVIVALAIGPRGDIYKQ